MSFVLYSWVVSYYCCLFSYHSLLELNYGGRMNKSQTAKKQAIKVGLTVREAERRLDAKLFLNEYPRWELGAPHQSVILHEMFLHAAKQGQKEAERFICWGHCGSLPRPDLEADQSAMKLGGIRPVIKRSRTFITVSTYWEDPWVPCHVGHSREGKKSVTFSPP